MSTLTTGLNTPRSLTFGPDGNLYVAEGGAGGISTTAGLCPHVPQADPYSGGFTARISRINPTDGVHHGGRWPALHPERKHERQRIVAERTNAIAIRELSAPIARVVMLMKAYE